MTYLIPKGNPAAVTPPQGRSEGNRLARSGPQTVEPPNNRLVAPAAFEDPAEGPPKPPTLQPATPEELPPSANIPAEELTLDQATALCLFNDPRIRAGLEAINQASADAVTASLKPNPILFTDGQLLQLAKRFTPTRQGGPPQQDIQLGYPIDWFLFGKRAAAMVSANQGVYVSQAEYENLIRERVTKAALAYYDVVETEGLLRLARLDVETLEQIAANTEKAVAAGGRPQVELNRIRLALGGSRRNLREAAANHAAARSRLNALVGGALTFRPFIAKDPFEQTPNLEIPSADAAFAIAVQNRPDLNALRWRVQQARSDMVVEARKAYPNVTMTFGYTRQYQLKAIGFPDADSWSAALGMPLPIWDRNQGNRNRAQATATQSEFELQAGEIELFSEVESVIAELTAARDNAAAIADADLQLAEQVLESISQAYGIGGRTLLDLLDAQRNYRETYRALTTTQANYGRARVRFQSAIGQQSLP